MLKQFFLSALIVSAAPISYAQFGSGIVFDPTQSAHAAQQILQANQLYTTTVETERNVIGAYNLAQKMANLPQALYTSYTNLGRQQWTILTQPQNTYGNSIPWMNAASAGYGAAAANQTASIPRTGQISGYGSLSPQGQQAIAARGATVDLSDAVNVSSLQTAGTIRANSVQREADISQLEAATHSSDPSQHTEMATRFSRGQTPLQQFYTPIYARSAAGAAFNKRDKYQLLYVGDGARAARLATEADVQAGTTTAPNGKTISLALSSQAAAQGPRILYRGPAQTYVDAPLNAYLRSAVFGGEQLRDIYQLPLLFGFLSLLAQLPFSIRKDIRRRKELKYGRRLKGPVLLTPRQFNKTVSGDGIGFVTTEAKEMMRIPLQAESQHIELMGDTGAGKTTLIMQVLRQIQSRGHAAIVYDPACEFIQRFYDQKREDIVLNPLDERCPYWGPSEELRRRAEAKAIAASLYQPTSDKKGEFFTETPQKIFAHLLTYGPNPQQLVEWLSKPAEIDQRVQGTEMEAMIAKGAQQQRNGVLASLGLVADSLRMLPTKEQAKNKTWSATEWSVTRKGWIFITSSPTMPAAATSTMPSVPSCRAAAPYPKTITRWLFLPSVQS